VENPPKTVLQIPQFLVIINMIFIFLVTVCKLMGRQRLRLQSGRSKGRVNGVCSYAIFQIPSNLILMRVGAANWLPVVVLGFGMISAVSASMKTRTSFYILRFFLGMQACGFGRKLLCVLAKPLVTGHVHYLSVKNGPLSLQPKQSGKSHESHLEMAHN
jgi:hypothetical protein